MTARLEVAALLDAAREQAGLDDFGADSFREGLRILVDSYEREAKLSVMGREAVRARLVHFLCNRLRIQDWITRHPEILDERIEQPLFVIGLPRTGTTLLHTLLSLDPLHRAPLHWEAEEPCPPPRLIHSGVDPRIQKHHQMLELLSRVRPELREIHPVDATGPTECLALLDAEFTSLEFETQALIPSYGTWLDQVDQTAAYAFHERCLQLLQWRMPNERWVLKSPHHLLGLEALLARYPDARILFTHRDPCKTIASQASLISIASRLLSDEVDPIAVGRYWAPKMARALERAIAHRDRARPEAFYDLHYGDFVADPVGAIRRAYSYFGLELSRAAERRMRAYLRDDPPGKRSPHRYSLEAFGLDASSVRDAFRAYTQRFGVPAEV